MTIPIAPEPAAAVVGPIRPDYPVPRQNLVGRSEIGKKKEIINNELLTKQRSDPNSLLLRTHVAAERGASTPCPA